METTIYTICTEHGATELKNRQKAIDLFYRVQLQGREVALYEGEQVIMKSDYQETIL